MTTVTQLRERIALMQSATLPTGRLPTVPEIGALLPGHALRQGAIYQFDGAIGLVARALAEASAAGHWNAWLGWPGLGAEALAQNGIRLERTVFIAQPGRHWWSALAALIDAVPLVVTRIPNRLTIPASDISRFAARLRERGGVLWVTGSWPGAEARLRVTERRWGGLIAGHGNLRDCELAVEAVDRVGYTRRGTVRLAPTVDRLDSSSILLAGTERAALAESDRLSA